MELSFDLYFSCLPIKVALHGVSKSNCYLGWLKTVSSTFQDLEFDRLL